RRSRPLRGSRSPPRQPPEVGPVRRFLFVSFATLALAPAAWAWTWPVDAVVLQPSSFDRAHPYAAGQHRAVQVSGESGEVVRAPVGGVVEWAGTVPGS